MSKNQPKVLLSIVTWNHEKSIRATIDSIYQQIYTQYHVVVFDNNSSDGTINILEEWKDKKNYTLIRNSANIGFCGGHNYVVTNFDYDIILLINPDVVLKEDYIEKAVSAFEIDPEIGAVCGLLVRSSDLNPAIDSMGMRLTRSRRFVLINHGKNLNSIALESGYVAGLDGALPAFRKETVESLLINGELFNSLFFSHKEDWDVSWRLLLLNWRIYFHKDCIAVHPRHFKPDDLKHRRRINSDIKYHGFKNQFLLLLINEDTVNFLKDFFIIVSRIVVSSAYCLLYERKSLKAYTFVIVNWKKILSARNKVQEKRKISSSLFRKRFLVNITN